MPSDSHLNVVRLLALDTGVTNFNVTYYDFRYPEATNLIIAADRVDGANPGDSFKINIPRGLTVYESSWSHAATANGTVYPGVCSLDNEQLSTLASRQPWVLATGELAQAKFSAGAEHTLAVGAGGLGDTKGYCGVAIVYREVAK